MLLWGIPSFGQLKYSVNNSEDQGLQMGKICKRSPKLWPPLGGHGTFLGFFWKPGEEYVPMKPSWTGARKTEVGRETLPKVVERVMF